MFMWVERIVMSYAYVMSFILWFGWVGMSEVYMLNSVGESTPPCRTPAFDFVLLYSLNCLRPRM